MPLFNPSVTQEYCIVSTNSNKTENFEFIYDMID